ncbi:MAG: VWA domain-containing protein [Candidatus Acidiferrales bacterium]
MNAHYATSRAIPMALLVWASLQIPGPSPTPPANSQGYSISREVDFVVLPVTVLDRKGQFVSGLDASNFRVYENGHPQTISLFRSEEIPVTVGIVVDRSGSMAARSTDVIEGAQAFVDASNPQDQEFVVNFTDKINLGLPANAPFTSDPSKLRAALSVPSASGQTALYDAVIAALQHVDRSHAGKKVLILISDGGDNASQHGFAQALRAAQSANVIIYSIGLYDEHSSDQNPRVLRRLATETGGLDYSPTTAEDVARVCRQIAGDIRHQYTIGYDPTDNIGKSYRKISVEVVSAAHGKLTVRTRAGYYPAAAKQAGSQAPPEGNR